MVKLLKCSIFFVLLLNIFEKYVLEEVAIRVCLTLKKSNLWRKDTSLMKKSIQHNDFLPVVVKVNITKKEVTETVSEFITSINDIADDDDDENVELSGSNPMLPNLEDVNERGLDD
ncbi:hypothetical protein MTR67_021802 [Solanum verrucosum]|uniref:Uncharacterized protein n=1 Tax=Solanum verrucosum TaxID=315347 RepID=A0AAF0TPY4_SOLVR|nr:hypothetical protein MTR67_021802 [Solanum verrucosum]